MVKKKLDHQTVVDVAVQLINKEGLAALSLSRLAKDLGVQTPSLYNHINGLNGLNQAFRLRNAQLLGESLANAAMARSGVDGIRAIMQAYRQYILSNPGLYLISLQASGTLEDPDPALKQAEDRVVKIGEVVLDSFGLRNENAIFALRALRSLVHGFATLEIADAFGLPLDREESYDRLVEIFISGLSNDQH